MCTHQKWVTNKYTGQRFLVKCGKCHSCQIEKANKNFSRIMNHEADRNYFRIFLTLNYANQALPYIKLSDYDLSSDTIEVWRDLSVYHYRKGKLSRTIRKVEPHIIGTLHLNEYDKKAGYCYDFSGTNSPVKFQHQDCIGVAFSKDFTDFMKRLKVNLKRHYNLDFFHHAELSYYKASEYGPTTRRPHFHAILYFPSEYKVYYPQIRRAIVKAWPFCSVSQLQRNISIAVTAQSYVSAYTVRPSDYPDFFRCRSFSQKTTCSRHFGFNRKEFAPNSILHDVHRHSFAYTYQTVDKDKRPCSVTASIPLYVYNYYFPKFKGAYKLSIESLRTILLNGNLSPFARYLGVDVSQAKTFSHQVQRACCALGISLYDYADLYLSYLRGRPARLQTLDYLVNYEKNPYQFYYDFSRCRYSSYQVSRHCTEVDIDKCCHDPNKFDDNISRTLRNELKYEERVKKVKFNSYCDSLQLHYYYVKLNNV